MNALAGTEAPIDFRISWGFLYAIVASAWGAWSVLTTAPKEVVAALVAALAVIGAALLNQYWTRKLAVEQELRKQKTEAYDQFLEFVFQILKNSKDGVGAKSQDQTVVSLWKLMPNMIMWGSDYVLAIFVRWWGSVKAAGVSSTPENTRAQVKALDDVLLAIRADLGYKNKGLNEGDLLSLFINDIREQMREAA